jgi:hypothetical protein
MTKWISVKDSLPEEKDYGYFLVCLIPLYKEVRITFALYDEDGFQLNHENITRIVSHWMLLPEPPND